MAAIRNRKNLFLLLTFLFFFSACSATDQNNSSENTIDEESESQYNRTNIAGDEVQEEQLERKIVKSGSMDLKSRDFDSAVNYIRSFTVEIDGFVESYNMYTSYSANRAVRRADFTLKIPSQRYEETKSEIEKLGTVISYSDATEDMTSQYYDSQTRLDMKVAERERLYELLEKADKIEDIIAIEARLSEVNGDIEIIESTLDTIDDLVSYATLFVHLSEDVNAAVYSTKEGLFPRMAAGFLSGIRIIVLLFEYLLIVLSALIVPGALLLILWFIGRFIFKKIYKKQ